jgi:hypothetical protein
MPLGDPPNYPILNKPPNAQQRLAAVLSLGFRGVTAPKPPPVPAWTGLAGFKERSK